MQIPCPLLKVADQLGLGNSEGFRSHWCSQMKGSDLSKSEPVLANFQRPGVTGLGNSEGFHPQLCLRVEEFDP